MIGSLDLTLFDALPSGSTSADRTALLAMQAAVRKSDRGYVYLEIGSHMGGTLQPHLLDPRCRKIYSIDKRLSDAQDVRGTIQYTDNTTVRMLEGLRKLCPDQMSKLVCFDGDAAQIDRNLIDDSPDICFVDAQHTDAAVVSDFEFCRAVAVDEPLVAFHDADLVPGGLRRIRRSLRQQGTTFSTALPGGSVYAVCIGSGRVLEEVRRQTAPKNEVTFFAIGRLLRAGRRLAPSSCAPALRKLVSRFKRFLRE